MTPPAAPPRKRPPGTRAGKEATATIRVAKVIAPVPPPRTSTVREPEEDLAPGLPCSGRCGHCHHHPCRLHGGV